MDIDYQKACRAHFEKLIKEGKPWCKFCFDERGKLTQFSDEKDDLICEDCIYMYKLLDEIKNIN